MCFVPLSKHNAKEKPAFDAKIEESEESLRSPLTAVGFPRPALFCSSASLFPLSL